MVGGNQDDLTDWVASLLDTPSVNMKSIVNVTNIMTSTFFPNQPNITTTQGNTIKALKAYLIDSQGCTYYQAINYNKEALVNDHSCFYSVFDGSYQVASNFA